MKQELFFKTYQKVGKEMREAIGFFQYLVFSGQGHVQITHTDHRLQLTAYDETLEAIEDIVKMSTQFLSEEWEHDTYESEAEHVGKFTYVNFSIWYKD